MKFLISIFLLLVFTLKIDGKENKDSLERKNLKVLPLPLFWYTPETKFGGGMAALFNFHFNKKDTAFRTSTIQIGEAFTQEKQWINFSSFQLFPHQEKFYIYGEAGYYKYRYYFFDIGNNNTEGVKEKYDINFTRIRSNFLMRFFPGFYGGIRYYFEKHQLLNLDSTGFLLQSNYLGVTKGTSSSLGLVTVYDTRDNIFFPSRGWYAELAFQVDDEAIGSDFSFSKFTMDVSKYFWLFEKHTFALNVLYIGTNGEVPFNHLAMFGGNKKMRGYYEGRFRDKHTLVLQTEFRGKISPRWGANVFLGVGNVSKQITYFKLNNFRLAGGVGLRFMIDTKQKINLRLDGALGIDKIKYYFTFNEAF